MIVLTGKRFETLTLPNYIQFRPICYSTYEYEYILSGGVGNSTTVLSFEICEALTKFPFISKIR